MIYVGLRSPVCSNGEHSRSLLHTGLNGSWCCLGDCNDQLRSRGPKNLPTPGVRRPSFRYSFPTQATRAKTSAPAASVFDPQAVPGELVRSQGSTQCHIVAPKQNNNSPATGLAYRDNNPSGSARKRASTAWRQYRYRFLLRCCKRVARYLTAFATLQTALSRICRFRRIVSHN